MLDFVTRAAWQRLVGSTCTLTGWGRQGLHRMSVLGSRVGNPVTGCDFSVGHSNAALPTGRAEQTAVAVKMRDLTGCSAPRQAGKVTRSNCDSPRRAAALELPAVAVSGPTTQPAKQPPNHVITHTTRPAVDPGDGMAPTTEKTS